MYTAAAIPVKVKMTSPTKERIPEPKGTCRKQNKRNKNIKNNEETHESKCNPKSLSTDPSNVERNPSETHATNDPHRRTKLTTAKRISKTHPRESEREKKERKKGRGGDAWKKKKEIRSIQGQKRKVNKRKRRTRTRRIQKL